MTKLKPGDRVRIFGCFYKNGGTYDSVPISGTLSRMSTIFPEDPEWWHIHFQDGTDGLAHSRQMRRLKPRAKKSIANDYFTPEEWTQARKPIDDTLARPPRFNVSDPDSCSQLARTREDLLKSKSGPVDTILGLPVCPTHQIRYSTYCWECHKDRGREPVNAVPEVTPEQSKAYAKAWDACFDKPPGRPAVERKPREIWVGPANPHWSWTPVKGWWKLREVLKPEEGGDDS